MKKYKNLFHENQKLKKYKKKMNFIKNMSKKKKKKKRRNIKS